MGGRLRGNVLEAGEAIVDQADQALAGEGFRHQQADETNHGSATIEFFGAGVKAHLLGTIYIHSGFDSEVIEATAIFSGVSVGSHGGVLCC